MTVLIIGVLTTFYTMLGGVKAVIWTDAIQVATAFLGFTIVAVSAIHVCRSGGDAKISDHQVGARNQQIPALPCAWKQNLRNPDALVPYYVAAILPHGLIGLVMASNLRRFHVYGQRQPELTGDFLRGSTATGARSVQASPTSTTLLRATGAGTIAGAALGFTMVVFVSIYSSISVFLYCAVGCAATVAAGWICSVRFERRPESNPAQR